MSEALLDKPGAEAHGSPLMAARRDTTADGTRNRIEFWLLTHGRGLWRRAQAHPRLERFINAKLIDSAVKKAPSRPYKLSTLATYPSWSSLTDKTYNSRQLPPATGAPPKPSAEAVAELFLRDGPMKECPKSTVLFAYFAQWFTDGFLRSKRPDKPGDPRDLTRNQSNPDVDLTQLYGVRVEMTRQLRAHEGGLLKFETIGGEEFPPLLCDEDGLVKAEFSAIEVLGIERLDAEGRRRLFAMGSDAGNSHIGYAMINVLFLREHNRLARGLRREHPKWDDERLFQTARGILTVLLIKLTIEQYINHIAPYAFQFRFAPESFWKADWYRPNWVAVEFNLLYRWHSLIPSTLHVAGRELTIEQTVFNNALLTERGLGAMFHDASGQRAGKVCLFNTDPWFHERASIRSVTQSRALQLRPYNAYREDCSLPPVTKFEQISSDGRVIEALERIYGSVAAIEFYPGIFAEDARPNSVLPSLLGAMVGVHAFSQLMTNPLLARSVWEQRSDRIDAFSAYGLHEIERTTSLDELLHRNVPGDERYAVRLTREGWRPE
ncbi:MAG: prostaglandin-endoperoxide synthase 2 [Solirubrobacteraceae bacterium]|nr:prostaglandin-endoperoxide synthase 2 [Solirubrobacteraceae bacterium]